MRRLKRLFSATLVTSFAVASPAPLAEPARKPAAETIYIWDNAQRGGKGDFVATQSCQLSYKADVRFRIASNVNAPSSEQTVVLTDDLYRKKMVPRYSLVKIIGLGSSGDSEYVEVTGVQPEISAENLVQRGAKGYIKIADLDYLTGFMIHLRGDIPRLAGTTLEPKNAMLKPMVSENRGYAVYICGDKIYNAFTLMTGKQGDTPATVGVYWDDTKVFSTIAVYPLIQANQILYAQEQQRLNAQQQEADAERMAAEAKVNEERQRIEAEAAAKKAKEDEERRAADAARAKAEAERFAAAEAVRLEQEKKQKDANYVLSIIMNNAGVGDRIRAEAAARKLEEERRAMEAVMDDPQGALGPKPGDDPEDEVADGATEDFSEEEDKEDKAQLEADENIDGDFNFVICLDTKDATIAATNESGEKVLFNMKTGTPVKLFQDFDGNATASAIKVQESRTSRVGWVLDTNIKQASQCAGFEPEAGGDHQIKIPLDADGKIPLGKVQACTAEGGPLTVYDHETFEKLKSRYFLDSGESATVIDGTLVDKKPESNGHKYVLVKTKSEYTRYVAADMIVTGNCPTAQFGDTDMPFTEFEGYVWPTIKPSGFSYLAKGSRGGEDPYFAQFKGYNNNWGMYGASRGSRGHAATDIYTPRGLKRPDDTFSFNLYGGPFRAFKNGTVVRGATGFYNETSYIVVQNDDGTVSRYGEIYGTTAYKNKAVKAGDLLGWVKWVGLSSVPPMLHFENYNDKSADVRKGILGGGKVVNGRNTKRSKHLFDRTERMKQLEMDTFNLPEPK